MKKRSVIAVALLCLLCTVCLKAPEKASAEETGAADSAGTEEVGLRLSQTRAVKRDKFEKEDAFADFLSTYEKAFLIPGLNEGAIPQGMAYCRSSGRIYISSYYSSELPSVITAVDAATGEFSAEYFLYNSDGSAFTSHVGGLACVGDMLCVSAKLDNDGEYSIGLIPVESLAESGSHELTVEQFMKVPVSPSFLNCSGGYLWSGNFYYPKADYDLPEGIEPIDGLGCLILGYSADSDLTAGDAFPELVLAAPDRIQGFTMTDNGHVLLSQSYGRKNNSALLEYEVDLSEEPDTYIEFNGVKVPVYILRESRQTNMITAMPMTEALCLDGQDRVLVLFESGALKYSDGLFRTDFVWRAKTPSDKS